MTDQDDWYRLISRARTNASQDLRISNNILSITDALMLVKNNKSLTEDQITEISKQLIQISMDLADRSKDMNFAITKLMGAI